MNSLDKTYAKDIAERVFWTFVQAFLGALPVVLVVPDWSTARHIAMTASVAGIAAVVALLKGLIASYRGNPYSASTNKNG